jgi:hypothetical protein
MADDSSDEMYPLSSIDINLRLWRDLVAEEGCGRCREGGVPLWRATSMRFGIGGDECMAAGKGEYRSES